MNDTRQFYRNLILEHAKSTKHVGSLPTATASATLHNPLCGDTITLDVEVDNGTVRAVRYQVQGCAIAKAVAARLADRVTGQPVEQVKSWAQLAHASVQGNDDLGFEELSGMVELPARERCATLPWDSLAAALAKDAPESSSK